MRKTEWSKQRSGGVSTGWTNDAAVQEILGVSTSMGATGAARMATGAVARGSAIGCGSQVFETRLQWPAGSQQPPEGAGAQAKQVPEIRPITSSRTRARWNARNTTHVL